MVAENVPAGQGIHVEGAAAPRIVLYVPCATARRIAGENG